MPDKLNVTVGRDMFPVLGVIAEDPVSGTDINEPILALDNGIEMIYIDV